MTLCLKRLYFVCAYAGSWLVFGLSAVVLNLLCLALFILRGRERARPAVREAIRRFLSSYVGWLRITGLVRVNWSGLDGLFQTRRTVCVANHPGLLDAVFLLSRLPDTVCIFKRAMLRNPFLAPPALMGGYPWCVTGPDFVRTAVGAISSGRNVLIFPEGTRTAAGAALNPLKPGFALIASHAGAPVQVIVISSSRDLLPRGRAWWSVPRLPATVDIRVDCRLPAPAGNPRATAALVESRLRSCLQ
jgi:1-acyl-sn-glycerol-3-phosphate acyltransferase